MALFHIAEREVWRASEDRSAYEPPTLESEGFIHLSTEAQWLRVAHTFYRGRADLVLLEIDPEKLTSSLRCERVGDEDFPHLYGALDIDAVTAVHPLVVGGDGEFVAPDGVRGVRGPRAP